MTTDSENDVELDAVWKIFGERVDEAMQAIEKDKLGKSVTYGDVY